MKKIFVFIAAAVIVMLSSCGKERKTQTVQTEKTEQNAADNDVQDVQTETADFTMTAMDGTEMSVAKEAARHTLTIIDFWASWCGPCRQEMPRLVKLYEAYKDKGLGIIGVSLDEDRTAWETAVARMNMSWPQLSDLQGWDNAAARTFEVNSIPYTIVVDSDCNIVAKGLRGDRLDRFVAERLDK